CFFTNTQFEYNARPGPIRDRLTESLVEWLELIQRLAAEAGPAGGPAPPTHPRPTPFPIHTVRRARGDPAPPPPRAHLLRARARRRAAPHARPVHRSDASPGGMMTVTVHSGPMEAGGHVETMPVHFDDLDAMGIVHNAKYAVMLERALSAYWSRHGFTFAD